MKFYDREKELEILEKAYSRKGCDMVIISGRRRVGKSRLIEEFTKNRKAVGMMIVPKEEKQVAKDLEEEIRRVAGYSPPFDSFKGAMEYLFEQDFDLVCLDEFPNVLQVNAAIPYEMQQIWDRYKDRKEMMIVFSGSYAGMMKKIFTQRKAPLFNRATNTILLGQLPRKTVMGILDDMGIGEGKERIAYYCLFGGVPYYYLLLEKQEERGYENAVAALFFEEGAQLREEGENILRQEFGNA